MHATSADWSFDQAPDFSKQQAEFTTAMKAASLKTTARSNAKPTPKREWASSSGAGTLMDCQPNNSLKNRRVT